MKPATRRYPLFWMRTLRTLNRWDVMMLSIAVIGLVSLYVFVFKPMHENTAATKRLVNTIKAEMAVRGLAVKMIDAGLSKQHHLTLDNIELVSINKQCYEAKDLLTDVGDNMHVAHHQVLLSTLEQCADIGKMVSSGSDSRGTMYQRGMALVEKLHVAMRAEKDQTLAESVAYQQTKEREARHTAAAMQVWVANH